MFTVLRTTWPLFLGLMLLMLGNGLQGTLLGIRGSIEGFSTTEMSLVMSAYFVGFLFASQRAPMMIRRVGHVRVFAALGSFISAALILFPAITEPWAWIVLRIVIGFSFCGVYITVESWLNDSATNETRGRALSLYIIVQMVGIIAAQALLNLADPAGFMLFIIPSVLVSIAFAPILLTASPAPSFADTKKMSIRRLFEISPLGCATVFVMGGIFSAMFGMGSVYGTRAGFSVVEISIFIAAIYTGGLVFQYPIGWASDRMDRRHLILGVSVLGAVVMALGIPFSENFLMAVFLGFLVGGVANPLYSLAIAYTNDYLEPADMAAASAGLLFLNGIGAIGGPLILGWMMDWMGPGGYYLFLAVLFGALAVYARWRMLRRRDRGITTPGTFVPMSPSTTMAAGANLEAIHEEHPEEAPAA